MNSKSFWKAITYRIGSISLTFILGLAFLHTVESASAITIVAHVTLTIWYVCNEKLWEQRVE